MPGATGLTSLGSASAGAAVFSIRRTEREGSITITGLQLDETRPSPARTRDDHLEHSRRRDGLLAFGAYLAASLLLFGQTSLLHLGSTFVGPVDAPLYVWSLAWWPHALAAGIDPLVSRAIYAPNGIDLSWVTSIPGPSLLLAPVTAAFGPVVSLNILLLASPALAGWGAYLVCRRVQRQFWPSLVGGYLFGFSMYMVGQMHGHVNLTLIFPVPLAIYLVLRRLDGTIGRRAFVALLALALAGEASISLEILLTMTVFGALAFGCAWAFADLDARESLRDLIRPIVLAYVIVGAALAPLLYAVFAGAGSVAISRPLERQSADLLEYVVPTRGLLVPGHPVLTRWRSDSARAAVENSAYLGLPLLGAAVLAIVRGRANRIDRALVTFAGLAIVCSLGPRLRVGGHTSIPLPWIVVDHVPGLRLALPTRFGVYVALPVAILLVRWLSQPASRARSVGKWALISVGGIFLLPVIPQPHLRAAVDAPPFFSEAGYRGVLTPGETVLVLHGRDEVDMLWQAEAGFAFNMVGGNTGSEPRAVIRDPTWRAIVDGRAQAVAAPALETFLRERGVRTVIVANHSNGVWKPLLEAIDARGGHIGDVWVYRLP